MSGRSPASTPADTRVFEGRLGDWLLAQTRDGQPVLSAAQLDAAVKEQQSLYKAGNYRPLGEILIKNGYCPEAWVMRGIAEQVGYGYLDVTLVAAGQVDLDAIRQLSTADLSGLRFCQAWPAIPLANGVIVTADPRNFGAVDHATNRLMATRSQPPALKVGCRSGITNLLAIAAQLLEKDAPAAKGADSDALPDEARRLIEDAIDAKATDIHLDPDVDANVVRVRYRVMGMCINCDGFPITNLQRKEEVYQMIVNRLKGWCEIPEGNPHHPADGQILYYSERLRKRLPLRVSFFPTYKGKPSLAIRLLNPEEGSRSLTELGLARERYVTLKRVISNPSGIFLTTGPTGSGKTTTLHAIIMEVSDPTSNIITIEDPVEYPLSTATQGQVNDKAGVDYGLLVRQTLRHDPDILLIGEIRDDATARETLRAANTGHLVFTTLHCNFALDSFSRLLDLDVSPYMVAQSVLGVAGQRLLHTLCSGCRKEAPVPPEAADAFRKAGLQVPAKLYTHNREGRCDYCGPVDGWGGRKMICELAEMSPELKDAVFRFLKGDLPYRGMEQVAIDGGWRPLRDDALRMLAAGETTWGEVLARVGSYALLRDYGVKKG